MCEAQNIYILLFCSFSCNAKAFTSFTNRTNNIRKCFTETAATIPKRFNEQQLVEWAEGQLVTKIGGRRGEFWSLWGPNKCGSLALCGA